MNCPDCQDTGAEAVPAVAFCTECGASACRDHVAVRPRRAVRMGVLGREDPVDPPARLIRYLTCDAAHRRRAMTPTAPPVTLFACIHNGGRSLAATVLAEHHGGERVTVRSAGSEPGESLNPVVVQVLQERGLSVEGEAPELLTYDGVQEADIVITMGCGETCPVFPGKTYEDWQLDDPKPWSAPSRLLIPASSPRFESADARQAPAGL